MPLHPANSFDCHDCPDSTCGQTFADLDAFHKHWTRHKRKCPFPGCEIPVKSKYNFGQHCARKHRDYFVEYQRIEITACKNHCGKVYSKANASNLRRHEKTCRGKRSQQVSLSQVTRQRPKSLDAASATHSPPKYYGNNWSAAHASQSHRHPPSDAYFEISSSSNQASPYLAPADSFDMGRWQENQFVAEAIETLQRVLADGPAADTLQVFIRSLDNLGYTFLMTVPLYSNTTKGESRQSDMSGPSTSQQDSFIQTIDTVDVDIAHVSAKEYELVENHEPDEDMTPETQDRIVRVTYEVGLIYDCMRLSH